MEYVEQKNRWPPPFSGSLKAGFSRTMPAFQQTSRPKSKMTSDTLSKQQIIEMRARAQSLNPVVMVGQKGLTEAVLRETDSALNAHGLIKVRVFGDEREERTAIADTLCRELGAQLVQHIGKLLVLYREPPAEDN
jgi:putative RNA-binding protein, yhbY family